MVILQAFLAKIMDEFNKMALLLNDDPTFGILFCKDKKKVTAELALKDINKLVGISEYKVLSEFPKLLENTLPSIKDIENRLYSQE